MEKLFSFFLLCQTIVHSEYIKPGPKFTCPDSILNDHVCNCTSSNDKGLNIICENANLATLSISLADISSSQKPIEKLYLNQCNITRLYGNIFYSLDIKILILENIPLKEIDEDTFLGINETLSELYIIKSQLEKVPSNALRRMGHLTKLVIDEHNIALLDDNTFQKGAWYKLEKLSITNGKIEQFTSAVFAPLTKLKQLDLHGNSIKGLKKNQFKGLKNVDNLDLSFNQIKKLEGANIMDLTSLGWFNISNNAIEDLGRSIFARNNLLKVVNVGHNQIKKIDDNTFKSLRLIRRLYLNNNNITEVGRSTFTTMLRIGTIDLSYNFIKKIDFKMFFELKNVEIINVSHNDVTEIEKLAFKDLYHVDILLSHNKINKIHTNAFINCANITHLDLSHNQLENFSKNAFDELTYPLVFQLSFNKIKETIQIPLSNMTGIKVLNISHNEIVAFSRNTFPKLYELHTIDASHNEIVHVSSAVFQPLLSLRFLNFSFNSLQEIKSETFGTLPTVLDLTLDHNNLNEISRGAFTKLSSLSTLNMKHNNISSMFELPISLSHLDLSFNSFETIPNSNVWPSMNALLSLNLSNNRIGDSLTKGSFYPLLTLQSLDLSNNVISQVPWEALSDFTSVRHLKMSSNKLIKLNKAAFGNLPVVFNLDLSYNQITNVSVNAFHGLLQLINLNLSHNNIDYIPNGAFQGLSALQTLDLSFNNLETIDNKTNSLFEDCLTMKYLKLSNNKLSFLTKKSIPYNQYYKYKLQHIDLSYNKIPVLTYDFTYGTKDIKIFDLSHNMINEIRRYVVGNLTSVEKLDLSYNEISNLHEKHVFKLPTNLTYLDLSYNLLSSVPTEEIVNHTNLKEINFQHNRFTNIPNEFLNILDTIELNYASNPLICDCYIIPIYKWLNNKLKINRNWINTYCVLPKPILIYNMSLETDIQSNNCPQYKSLLNNINIRKLNKMNRNENLYINWYINNNRDDIAEVKLFIKQNNSVLLDRIENYNTRFEIVSLKKLKYVSDTNRHIDVCIVSIDSSGNSYEDDNCMSISQAQIIKFNYLFGIILIICISLLIK